jgi:type IV pilus assembly protein PilN
MIRINLLEQPRPKAARRAVPIGATLPVVLLAAAVGVAALVLAFTYFQMEKDIGRENDLIKQLRAQKTDLERVKQEVEAFEGEKKVLQQRVSVIEQLQRDRTGGQELLDMVANTVSRTDNLWLTSMERKGDALAMRGSAASINSVANFITQLKRSGYFQKIEIKETKQDTQETAVQTFTFELSADIVPPQASPSSAATGVGPAPHGSATGKKG